MSDFTDALGLLHAYSQSAASQDIANTIASDPTAYPDPPGAPVNSGLNLAWSKDNSGPLPPGLQGIAQQRLSAALQPVAQAYADGKIDQPTALMQMGAMKGEDPAITVGKIAAARGMGFIPTPNPNAQANPVAQANPNLAAMGGSVQAAPLSPMGGDSTPNAPAPSNVSGSMPYPGLAAANGLLTGNGQPPTSQQQTAPIAPRTVSAPTNGAPQQQPQPQAATGMFSPAAMAAQVFNGGNPIDVMKAGSELQKNAAAINKDNADAAHTQSTTVFSPSGAPISDAQKDEDKQFGPVWGTFKNQGGSDQIRIANQAIDDALNKFRNRQVTSGSSIDAYAANLSEDGHPGIIGSLVERPLISTKTEVDSAISPLLKPLFGARVTNFEASNLQKSLGIDPAAPVDLNIKKLERLKDKINSGALALQASGNYFDTHGGTLAGYPGETSITQPNNQAPQIAQRTYGTQERAKALQDQLAKLKASRGGQ